MKQLSYTLTAFLLFLLSVSSSAQLTDQVPLDDRVQTGQLENGLKYFIMENKKPEKKVEMRLVINAGAVLESDAQQGLAHFCEHMAFNGSKNFKKNELVDYLQSAGVKFGAHLNAYTSFDETVYMLSLPTEDASVLNNGYQILEDWAAHLLFDQTEIDKERGVVLEEYRLGLGAQKRMLAEYLPKLLYGSKYAERLPIGKKDVLEKFERPTLTSFYQNWYRPDLMAVIIVGDISKADAEKQIKAHFGKLTNPKNAPKRPEIEVPDHPQTFVTTVTDAEASVGIVQIAFKQPGMFHQETTTQAYSESIKQSLFYSMLNERLRELMESPDAAFTYGYAYQGTLWARHKEAVQAMAVVSKGRYQEALEQMLTELYRAKQHGFTHSELERAKSRMNTSLERAVSEMDKTESRNHAGQLVAHFLENEPFASPSWEMEFIQRLMDEIDLTSVNNLLSEALREENRVVVMTGPESDRESMPSEDKVITALNRIASTDIPPKEDQALPESLMDKIPAGGKVVSENTSKDGRVKSIKLSNGVVVHYMPTQLKNDEIVFNATSFGGTNMLDDATYQKVNLGLQSISNSGVGPFSSTDLNKVLSGKAVGVYPNISSSTESFGGRCRPTDMEQLFQLLNLYFTQPRFDPQSFDAYVKRQRSFYDNMGSNPASYFSVKWSKFVNMNHARSFDIPTESDWNSTDLAAIEKVYRDRFANPADFNFCFVGNIDEASLKNYCATYLGGLKTSDKREKAKDINIPYRSGTERLTVNKGADPKSQVRIAFHKDIAYDPSLDLKLDMAAEVLTIKMIEVLREDMSGVYGTSARNYFSRSPKPGFSFYISFPCGPENVDTLIGAALHQLKLLAKDGPTQKDLDKVKQTMIKEVTTDVQSNSFWLNCVTNSLLYGDPIPTESEVKKRIELITREDVKAAVATYLQGDYLTGVLLPEND